MLCSLVLFLLQALITSPMDNVAGNKEAASFINFSGADCNQRLAYKGGRIVGGEVALEWEFPWLVSLQQAGAHVCGGIILNKWWTVTAAHCFCGGDKLGKSTKIMVSRSGSLNQIEQTINVKRLHKYPKYRCEKHVYDVALLQHESPLNSPFAFSACFLHPSEPIITANNNARVVDAISAGWGSIAEYVEKGSFPKMIHKVQIPIIKNEDCESMYGSQNKTLKLLTSQICAGLKEGGKDSCWADSGGPLMVKLNGQLPVIGIISFGIGCAQPNLPGIYTKLSEFLPWISGVVNGTTLY